VKVVDANILLYSVNPGEPRHHVAKSWLDASLSGRESVGFAWAVVTAFLRISTLPGLFVRPLAIGEALSIVEAWLDQPPALLVEATPRHFSLVRGLLEPIGFGGNLVNDAHLAALAIEHGAEVVSFDTDFARFAGLRWQRLG
jgi:uncharacterized protein